MQADRKIAENEKRSSERRKHFYRNLVKPLPKPYKRDNPKPRKERMLYNMALIHSQYSDGVSRHGLISSAATPQSERLSRLNTPSPLRSRRHETRTDSNPAANASNPTDTSSGTQDSVKVRLLEEKLDALTKMMEQVLAARA